MRAVQRWRYYCDFCKKAGQSGFHMKNHESVCTLNPVRVCKMCALLDGRSAADMTELLAVLPDPALHMVLTTYSRDELRLDDDAITPLIAAALPVLRELTHNCPVCILAALRQKKIPVPLADGFDYKAEMKSHFDDINGNREDYEHY